MVKHRYIGRMMAVGIVCAFSLGACGGREEVMTPTSQIVESTPAPASEASTENESTEQEENLETMKRQQYEELFKEIEIIKSHKGLLDTNPIMSQRFGADPYAMPYGDRVYFYMTGDAFEYDANGEVTDNTYSKIRTINVVSTADMVNFEDHGVIRAAGLQGSAKWANNSWAPAAAWKNIDGKDKFFLYFANSGGGIGVLTADSPTGPFKDPLGEALVSRNTPNCSDVLWLFDPAVLVDEDGRAYLYFGGGVPEGKVADPGTARVVELGEDMISIKGAPVPIDVPYLFEDSGIHKFNNKYYYTYCTNWQVDQAGTDQYGFHNAEIVSLESDSPMGPFVFKGKETSYADFMKRIEAAARGLVKMGIEKGYRCTHVDAFTIQEDGTIGKIKQTLNGREQLQYADAYVKNQASCVAVMSGVTGVPMDAESAYHGSGAMALGEIKSGAFVKVQGVDFGEKAPTKCIAEIKNNEEQAGVIQVRADKLYGEVLGYLAVDALTDGEFQEFTAPLETELTGVHDLYFIFAGEGYEVSTWRFE